MEARGYPKSAALVQLRISGKGVEKSDRGHGRSLVSLTPFSTYSYKVIRGKDGKAEAGELAGGEKIAVRIGNGVGAIGVDGVGEGAGFPVDKVVTGDGGESDHHNCINSFQPSSSPMGKLSETHRAVRLFNACAHPGRSNT